VLATVELDSDLALIAIEIHNEPGNRHLPAKLETSEPPIAQARP
jgi:hypothetical protein